MFEVHGRGLSYEAGRIERAPLILVSDARFASSRSEVRQIQKLNLACDPDVNRMIKSFFSEIIDDAGQL